MLSPIFKILCPLLWWHHGDGSLTSLLLSAGGTGHWLLANRVWRGGDARHCLGGWRGTFCHWSWRQGPAGGGGLSAESVGNCPCWAVPRDSPRKHDPVSTAAELNSEVWKKIQSSRQHSSAAVSWDPEQTPRRRVRLPTTVPPWQKATCSFCSTLKALRCWGSVFIFVRSPVAGDPHLLCKQLLCLHHQ